MRKATWIPLAAALVIGWMAMSLYPQARKTAPGPKASAAGVAGTPAVVRITDSTEEQDHPALASTPDALWVSYVEFTHSDRSLEGRGEFGKRPASFDFLARPAGGDRVWLMRYSKSERKWGAPMPVSAAKQDVMRAAVAVDGSGRVWVVWSANRDGNFDLYARNYGGGKWSAESRLTSDAGTDVNPVAATDARGRVWVAWQAFRNGNLEILAAAQQGDRFSAERLVSTAKASDWDPAIAAAPNGDIAVAWDTYDKGDYDVWFRRMRYDGDLRMDAPVAAAVSPNFEARAAVAYDGQNRVWIAYEASLVKWGKDFGAYETTGVALYQDHTIRVKCFPGTQPLEPPPGLDEAMPGRTGSRVWGPARKAAKAAKAGKAGGRRGRAREPESGVLPDPTLADDPGNAAPRPSAFALNSFPRLAVDGNGTVYLSFRTPSEERSSMGTAWTQHLVYASGDAWKGPIEIPRTDTWGDSRPAMAAVGRGELAMIAVTDHRLPEAGAARARRGTPEGVAATNADLVAVEFRLPAPGAAAQATPGTPLAGATPWVDAEVAAERRQVAMMRQYKAQAGGRDVQLLRGEFHRHTEMSGDGGKDGPLIDAYRYLIDSASMDWGGCCDHDNGAGREYSWWTQQKLTDAYHMAGAFVPMFSYERSVRYPEGHRNTVMARRGVRPLPRLPKTEEDSPANPAPDTQMLYRYLKQFGGIVASHTSGTGMGTDWRDNDPLVEPVVEIYQGDRQNYEMPKAPRSLTVAPDHLGWVSLALKKGYRLGFQASSDHISTHMSYCNLWVTERTREGVMEAFRKRRIYGATDNILADVRCGTHFMGEEFTVSEPPALSIKLWGMAPFAKVHVIRDGEYVYTAEPKSREVSFTWRDASAKRGTTSYYYVRGEQQDGELVWVSPMWIAYK